jgi:V/A-type H+-transporting ATPase subunit F
MDSINKVYKIGVIGDKESVIGFRAVGFSVFEAADAEEAEVILNKAAKENYAVIYITENLAEKMQSVISEYRSSPLPAIILIPGKSGSGGFGLNQIKKSVERAVGADILFKEKK